MKQVTETEQLIGQTIKAVGFDDDTMIIAFDDSFAVIDSPIDWEGDRLGTHVAGPLVIENRSTADLLHELGVMTAEDLQRWIDFDASKRSVADRATERRERAEYERLKKKFAEPSPSPGDSDLRGAE